MYDGGYSAYSQTKKLFQFSAYIFSADITSEMLKLRRVTKVKVFFLVLVYDFNIDVFEFSVAILEKGLLHKFPLKTLKLGWIAFHSLKF